MIHYDIRIHSCNLIVTFYSNTCNGQLIHCNLFVERRVRFVSRGAEAHPQLPVPYRNVLITGKTHTMIKRLLCCFIFAIAIIPSQVFAEDQQTYSMSPEVIEGKSEGQQTVGPYNQPEWSTRGRFSSDTEVYVIPPGLFFVDMDYTGLIAKHGPDVHTFTQEFELGLPHHFQIAFENNFEVRGPHTQETQETIEGRYALADWGKIPLNPTLFGEWHFGVGKDYENQGDPDENTPNIPDSFELRLLLGQQFGKNLQWAFNVFHEQQVGGDREWETGFSQALSYAILDEYLKAGIEMEFIRRTDTDTRSCPEYEFDIGPSFTWKPSRRTRLDFAPLFGTTRDSPVANIFAVFSFYFGSGEEEMEGLQPVSTEHR